MTKRIILTTLVALGLLGSIFGYKYYQSRQARQAAAARQPAPATVTAVPAAAEQWRETVEAIGSLVSHQGVTIRSEIEGRLVRIAFESGARVQAGDVLVELDTATELAQLRSQEAAARLAELNLGRARELQLNNTNTRADLDTAEAVAAQAHAAIASTQATLAKKRIVAPFSGRLGLRLINTGQFLNKGDAVVTLEAVDPVYVDFSLPQQEVPRIRPGLSVHVTLDVFPGRTFTGLLEAVDPRIEDATRSLRARATLPNPDEALRPGMFARVEVLLPEHRAVIVVPSTAIVYSPYGNSVYVIERDGSRAVARQRFVEIGPKRGDQVAILGGLQAGEETVSAGQAKLRPGSAVRVNNAVSPTNDPDPRPPES